MKPTERAKQALAYKLVDYLCDDPENNMANIMGKIDALAPASLFAEQRAAFSDAIKNKTNMYQLIMRVMDLNPEVRADLLKTFVMDANFLAWGKQEKMRERHQCNIPWAILLDPTSACNLHCTGCWAAEYGHALNLAYDEIDSIIRQGKEQNYQPELFVEAVKGMDLAAYEKDLTASMEKVSAEYPGVALNKVGDGVWQVEIPAKYRVGHEAHFGQVTEHFLDYLKEGKLPDWEVPNMLAKYYTTTSALDMAKAKK